MSSESEYVLQRTPILSKQVEGLLLYTSLFNLFISMESKEL